MGVAMENVQPLQSQKIKKNLTTYIVSIKLQYTFGLNLARNEVAYSLKIIF
jgi:hypothetical protein